MRNKSIIFLLSFVVVFAMASVNMPVPQGKKTKKTKASAVVVDTLLKGQSPKDSKAVDKNIPDTTKMDSLQLAIYHHNKAIDDSIRADSMMRARSNGIDAPVKYSAEDSLVYDAESGTAYLYGNSKVDYENMKLTSDKVHMNLDKSTVRATGTVDSTAEGGIKGKPVFTMGKDEYKSDTMAFNFKSKKGLIKGVYTEQQDGFLSGEVGKRDSTGSIYLQHGRYTTCDKPHPDFYIALSRAKVRPGKDVVFGPAYLVVADVPLPLAIPYGFFPFSKKYSSGFIMPSYGDESDRGFYLRDGGYYFAISDKWDLKLLGEIYTKGSWGVSAASNYRKRYRYSGSFLFSYQDSKTGDKGLPDFAEQESFKIQWNHRQDPKANPYSSLAASVNFATSNYERNNLNSMYNPQTLTQTTRTSSVSWSTGFSSIGLSLSATTNLAQDMRTSSIQITLPDLNISLSRFYPFKRKHLVGKERWYEKISMSYTGQLANSISTTEDKILHSNLIKDWKNAFQHTIPVQANFTLFNYINVTPSFNFTDRMYSKKVTRGWDNTLQKEVVRDTTYGFHNVYNWSMSVGASTKLYGFWVPNRKLFGDKIQAIRHVITPQVTFSYSPNFGARRYGYYDSYQYTDASGNVKLVEYSPYQDELYSVPGKYKTEMISWDVSNNIEMKIKSDKDTTGYKKISIIDELGASMSYNAAADYHRWSDLSMRLRLKWWKNYTFSMNAQFATYAYELDANGKPYVGNHTEWGYGRLPRFQGMSQNFSFTLNPEKLKKWFGRKDDKDDDKVSVDSDGPDTNIESNMDDDLEKGKYAAKKKRGNIAETDDDGYMSFNMPWSLTIGYGITMRENTAGRFNTKTMRYPYKFTQTLNFSGNIRISDGWNINFSSGYDFENHAMSMTTASLSRDLHCFNMSASVVLAPYTSYNFTFRCNAATLTDALKYDKRSGITNAVQWY
ncbi:MULTISPECIES: putative LPS assembly protein LptD [Prevotella]|uniref:putative LPS assembly protein LptD n=1 Tax=Prevotella melaninogenica TaxID=28132 RepID=UPI001C5EE99E|nr:MULTISPECIES: putative LPS assembly protein LptD [Prevotella]MBF1617238.1 LPS-assembly protein LptD [Prevotella sp.]MBW4895045.1 LPS-assembly protein LptD [Prevotella melaninogenica]UEA99039.1 LPS-assembly protein LptD [Prevotella melaninogenica]